MICPSTERQKNTFEPITTRHSRLEKTACVRCLSPHNFFSRQGQRFTPRPCLINSNDNITEQDPMTATIFNSMETVGSVGEIIRNSGFDSLESVDLAMLRSLGSSSPRNVSGNNTPKPAAVAKRSTSESEKFMSSMLAILDSKPSPERVTSSTASGLHKRELEEATASQSWNNLGAIQDVDFGDVFRTQEDITDKLMQVKIPAKKTPVNKVSGKKFLVLPQSVHSADVIVPNDNDVLLGRGGRSSNWPGNKRYLALKDEMQQVYLTAEKSQKKAISQQLVDIVKNEWKGRFLKLENGKWFEIDNEKARHKCSQALREINTPEVRAQKRARYKK